MEFECSFDEYGEYTGKYAESGNAWNSMRIDSVSIVPSNTEQVENVYSADCNNLSDVSNRVCSHTSDLLCMIHIV